MPGKIVKTKTGHVGRTRNGDKPVNGKVVVHLDDGKKILCNAKDLIMKGYWD